MTLKRTKRCYSLDTYFDKRNSQLIQYRISNRTIFANYLAERINQERENEENENDFKNIIINKQKGTL